jgi:hypothetical protein
MKDKISRYVRSTTFFYNALTINIYDMQNYYAPFSEVGINCFALAGWSVRPSIGRPNIFRKKNLDLATLKLVCTFFMTSRLTLMSNDQRSRCHSPCNYKKILIIISTTKLLLALNLHRCIGQWKTLTDFMVKESKVKVKVTLIFYIKTVSNK